MLTTALFFLRQQAVENASLRHERDEMEKRGVSLTKELHETREALVEAKAVGAADRCLVRAAPGNFSVFLVSVWGPRPTYLCEKLKLSRGAVEDTLTPPHRPRLDCCRGCLRGSKSSPRYVCTSSTKKQGPPETVRAENVCLSPCTLPNGLDKSVFFLCCIGASTENETKLAVCSWSKTPDYVEFSDTEIRPPLLPFPSDPPSPPPSLPNASIYHGARSF